MPAPLVLVLENEWIIAENIRQILLRSGYEVLGPAASTAAAIDLMNTSTPRAALLDVMLRGENCFDVADLLARRGVPFAFLSAYEADELPSRFQGRRLLRKPFRDHMLIDEAELLLKCSVA